MPDIFGRGASLGRGLLAESARHLAAVLDAEKVTKAHIVGISLGAVLAADFADQHPLRVASLVCIGGYDINNFDLRLQKANAAQQAKLIVTGLLSIRRFAEANKAISAYTLRGQERFAEMNLRFKKSSLKHLSSLGKLMKRHQSVGGARNTVRTEPGDTKVGGARVGGAKVGGARRYPLLIGVGDHDNPMATSAAEQWAQHEPEACFVRFAGAGHVVNLDTPEAFNHQIEKFIQAGG